MNMKLTTLTAIALLTPAISMAQYFEGFYAGVNAGIGQSQEQITNNLKVSVPVEIVTINANLTTADPAKLTDTTGVLGLSLGYSYMWNPCISVGAELRGTYQDYNMFQELRVEVPVITSIANLQTNLKASYQYGILAKVGFLMAPQTQVYGMAGPQWQRFRFNASTLINFVIPEGGPTISEQSSGSSSTTKWGYLVGLGIEQGFCKNNSIALEYNYANSGSVSVPSFINGNVNIIGAGDEVPTISVGYHNKVKFRSNTTMLRYSYYFC